MQRKVEFYGQFRPTGVDSGSVRKFQALAGIAQNVGDIAFNIGAKERTARGQREGAIEGAEAAKTGKAVERESDLTIYGQSYNHAMNDAYISGMNNNFRVKIAELEANHGDDIEAFSNAISAYRQGVNANSDPDLALLVGQSFDDMQAQAVARVTGNTVERNRREAADVRINSARVASNEASRFARLGDIEAADKAMQEAEANYRSLEQSGDISKTDADEAIEAIKRERVEQGILHSLSEMPLDQAQSIIEASRNNVQEGFTGDQWDALVSRAESSLQSRYASEKMQQAEKNAEYRNMDANLRTLVALGEGDPSELMDTAIELFNSGYYTPEQFSSARVKIIENGTKMTDIADRLAGDQSVVVDPKAADAFYKRNMAGANSAQKVGFARQLGYIPSGLEKEITNGLRASDPQVVTESIMMMDQIDNDRTLPDQFSANDRAFASQVTSLLDFYPPEQAVKMALDRTDPRDKARVAAAEEYLKKEYKADDYFDTANDVFDGWFASPVGALDGPEIAKDYQKLFEQHYISGMDEDEAKSKAEQLLSKAYSEWGGYYMKHSPDKYYSVKGDSDWVMDEIKRDLIDNVWFNELQSVQLISDDTTALEAKNGQPSYLVRYKTENGWEIFGKRWKPDYSAKLESSKLTKEQAAEMRAQGKRVEDIKEPLFRGF